MFNSLANWFAFCWSLIVTSWGDVYLISLDKVALLIAAKQSTDKVIAEIIAITVSENAFFWIRYIIDEENMTSFTLITPFLNLLIILNTRDTELLKNKYAPITVANNINIRTPNAS